MSKMHKAHQLIKAAADVGFRWPDGVRGATKKMREELIELEDARSSPELLDEVGDVLFVAVTCAFYSGISPDEAMDHAIDKFRRRIDAVIASGAVTLDEMISAWNEYK